MNDKEFKTWVCLICGWVYDEEAGAPDDGIVLWFRIVFHGLPSRWSG